MLSKESELAVRQACTKITQPYREQYAFDNTGGHFNDRVIRHLNEGRSAKGALYLALTGGCCKNDRSSIPCKVRGDIEDAICAELIDSVLEDVGLIKR